MRSHRLTTTRQVIFNILFLLTIPLFGQPEFDPFFQDVSTELLFKEARRIRYESPDSALRLLEYGYQHFMNSHDTLNAIQALYQQSVVNGNQANYVKAYDVLWKALLLADESNELVVKSRIYVAIGRHYSFYKRKEDAVKYFQLALDIAKMLVKEQALKPSALTYYYYAFTSTYRELDEPILGKTYLDSCYLYLDPVSAEDAGNNIDFEKAFLLNKEGKHQESLNLFESITTWYEENQPSYFVLVYTYMGDVYNGMNDLKMSEEYYNIALEASRTYHSHIDFTPLIYERLASLYLSRENYQKAYQHLKIAKELDAAFFDSRSENNRPLFEIQDAYREEKEYQKELIRKQHIAELEHQEKVSFLQKVILAGALVLLLILGLWYLNYVRNKHKAEKLILRQKQEMEIQKANELVELKNKELAASALKLIEKDELFSTLKSKIQNGDEAIPARDLKQIIKSNSVNNARNWKEFEARFVSVNESFYTNLAEKFPDLSRGDQKLCALIKLNFSSKEMAKLLGISIESVHTSRYRLRKKMNLPREVNLSSFIGGI